MGLGQTQDKTRRGSASIIQSKQLQNSGITLKVVITSVLFMIFFKKIGFSSDLGGFEGFLYFDTSTWHPAVGVLAGIMLIVLLVNPLFRKLKINFAFSQKELVVLYTILISASAFGIWLSTITALNDLAFRDPRNFTPIYDRFSEWIQVKNDHAVADYYLGGAKVPWKYWIRPIVNWSVFSAAVIFVSICLSSIVRRRWSEHEQLTYPVVAPTIELVRNPKDNELFNDFFKNRLMWIGALVAAFWVFLYSGKRIFPWLPSVDSWAIRDLMYKPFWDTPYRYMLEKGLYRIDVNPLIIGVAYLVNQNILFSMVFFMVLKQITGVGYILAGLDTVRGVPGYEMQYQGALLGLGIAYIWMMRRELQIIWRETIGKETTSDSRGLRFAVIGGLVGFMFLVVWSVVFLKITPGWAVIFFLIYFVMTLGHARARSEGGIGFYGLGKSLPRELLYPILGQDRVGYDNILGFGFLDTIGHNRFSGASAYTLESYKMADSFDLDRKTINTALGIGVAIGAVLIALMSLPDTYKHGANLITGTYGYPRYGFTWVVPQALKGELKSDSVHILYFVIGMVTPIVLSVLRSMYVWWPFHPFGYVYSLPESNWVWAGNFFIAWLVKAIVFRYGGYKLYKSLIPIFLGLVVGTVLMKAIFGIALLFTL